MVLFLYWILVFNFIVESKGQLDGYRIIEVALINIISTIESLLKSIPTDQTTHVGEIIINNEYQWQS